MKPRLRAVAFITWKREGWLAPYVTVDIAENVAPEMRDPDGTFVNQRTHLSAMAYNSSLVKPEDAPKGFMDLLDPKSNYNQLWIEYIEEFGDEDDAVFS